MKQLEKIVVGVVLGTVLGATAVTLVNVKGYLDAREEIMIEIKKETGIESTTMGGQILEMNSCTKIAEPYKQELQYENGGIFKLGRRYMLREYTDNCISADNVGII